MKKVLALILSVILATSMAACSGGDSGGGNAQQENQSSSSQAEEKRDYNVVIVNDDLACRIPLTWTKEASEGEVIKYTLPSGAVLTITPYEKEGVSTVNDIQAFYLDEYQAANGTVEVVSEKVDAVNAQMTLRLDMKLTPADGSAQKSVYQYVVVRNGGYIVYDFTMEGEFDKDTKDAIEKIAVRLRPATANDKKEAEEVLS